MSLNSDQPEKSHKNNVYTVALGMVVGLVGFLTLAIILVAIFGGLWLDSRMGTRPMFTIGLVILSIPLTLLVMFWVVRAVTSRLQSDKDKKENDQ